MRIGVIGSGRWGSNHARTLARLGALGAVADRDPSLAQRLASETQVAVLSTEAMLADSRIDGVVLALPPALHASFALRALKAGKHLLVEKPMALDTASATAIVELARARQRIAMTGHLLRFHPAFVALLRLVDLGSFGRLRHIETTRLGMGRFFDQADALWDLAPHDLSLILALTGTLPESQHMASSSVLADGGIDIAHLHFGFEGGVSAHCHVSRLSPTMRSRRLVALCDTGSLVLDDGEPWGRKLAVHRHLIHQADGGPISVEVSDIDYVDTPHQPPLEAELSHFITCIATGQPPMSDVSEGLSVLRILDQLRTAASAARPPWGEAERGSAGQRLGIRAVANE